MKTCKNCGKKRKIKADWCKCKHTNDVFVLEQRELDRIDEKFKAPNHTHPGQDVGRRHLPMECGNLLNPGANTKAPENAGCGNCGGLGYTRISLMKVTCPNCKNAGGGKWKEAILDVIEICHQLNMKIDKLEKNAGDNHSPEIEPKRKIKPSGTNATEGCANCGRTTKGKPTASNGFCTTECEWKYIKHLKNVLSWKEGYKEGLSSHKKEGCLDYDKLIDEAIEELHKDEDEDELQHIAYADMVLEELRRKFKGSQKKGGK